MKTHIDHITGGVLFVHRSQKKKSNISRNQLDSIFMELEHKVITLIKNELKRFRKLLRARLPSMH
ncbi:hypothetical protein QTP86_031121 [Hemibagrus guttatus]|nr:hypothetical protein QTP86_031121 [Hemibagrus guttatus]